MSITKTSNSSTILNQQDTGNYVKDVDKDLQKVVSRINKTPNITSGTAAPTTTPSRIGNMYVDTNNKKIYFATGHASSSDWTLVN